LIITLFLSKTPIFSPKMGENRRKSTKIVIITCTPGHPGPGEFLRTAAAPKKRLFAQK
jgi:hypothetical protein